LNQNSVSHGDWRVWREAAFRVPSIAFRPSAFGSAFFCELN
jgi:hypothetical protein